MAPFAPFLAERMYQSLPKTSGAAKSVHLCDYPTPNESMIQTLLEQAVARMQSVILLGRQKRNQAKVKTKFPSPT